MCRRSHRPRRHSTRAVSAGRSGRSIVARLRSAAAGYPHSVAAMAARSTSGACRSNEVATLSCIHNNGQRHPALGPAAGIACSAHIIPATHHGGEINFISRVLPYSTHTLSQSLVNLYSPYSPYSSYSIQRPYSLYIIQRHTPPLWLAAESPFACRPRQTSSARASTQPIGRRAGWAL